MGFFRFCMPDRAVPDAVARLAPHYGGRRLRGLTRTQRLVLQAARRLQAHPGEAGQATDAALPADALADLGPLVIACTQIGIRFSRPGCLYVLPDEDLLLGAIGFLAVRPAGALTGCSIAEALGTCAASLRRNGHRLRYSPLQHALLLDRAWVVAGRPGEANAAPRMRAAPPRPGSILDRVSALLRTEDVLSARAFISAGVSRQNIHRLLREGALQRVSYGHYRLSPPIGPEGEG